LAYETPHAEQEADARQDYRRPQLIEYGTVAVVTESGAGNAIPAEDTLYYLS
jgi:hypothetical protein